MDLKDFADGMLKFRLLIKSLLVPKVLSSAKSFAILFAFSFPHLDEVFLPFSNGSIESTFRSHGSTTRRRLEPDPAPLCFLFG